MSPLINVTVFVSLEIFNELNSPYKDLAKRDISKLKEGIGDSLFDRYWEEITANSSKRDIVIKCWNGHKKFTPSVSELNPAMTIYKGQTPSTRPIESRTNKKLLLKTCHYCGKENEIYI